jgi:hypothetical protein
MVRENSNHRRRELSFDMGDFVYLIVTTTSEMRGLSPKIISGNSRWSENAQTHTYKHAVPYMKFKLNLLQIKCHVLEFTNDEAQKMLQEIIRVFVEAFVSHDKHMLFALKEDGPPWTTYTCESQ